MLWLGLGLEQKQTFFSFSLSRNFLLKQIHSRTYGRKNLIQSLRPAAWTTLQCKGTVPYCLWALEDQRTQGQCRSTLSYGHKSLECRRCQLEAELSWLMTYSPAVWICKTICKQIRSEKCASLKSTIVKMWKGWQGCLVNDCRSSSRVSSTSACWEMGSEIRQSRLVSLG